MTQITLDEATLERIRAAGGFAQVRDAQGRYVAEIRAYENPISLKDLDPGVTDEELRRRERAGGGRPLFDILRDLEKRA